MAQLSQLEKEESINDYIDWSQYDEIEADEALYDNCQRITDMILKETAPFSIEAVKYRTAVQEAVNYKIPTAPPEELKPSLIALGMDWSTMPASQKLVALRAPAASKVPRKELDEELKAVMEIIKTLKTTIENYYNSAMPASNKGTVKGTTVLREIDPDEPVLTQSDYEAWGLEFDSDGSIITDDGTRTGKVYYRHPDTGKEYSTQGNWYKKNAGDVIKRYIKSQQK